jgi:hypothetical protein
MAQIGILRDLKCFLPVNNFLACDLRFIAKKWRIANEHLKEYNSNAPPIDGFRVSFLRKNFGSNIIRSSNSGVGELKMTLSI